MKCVFSVIKSHAENFNCLISDDGRTKPIPRAGRKPLPEPSEYMCLMRAQLKGKKITTVVSLFFFYYKGTEYLTTVP